MRIAAALLLFALCLSLADAYYIKQSRDQLLDYYFAYVDGKVPRSARMLIGDERINAYIGSQEMGIETRRGQLYSFEMYAFEKPTIVVRVTDDAADRLSNREIGIMQAIDSGGIKIEPKTLLSSIKVEMIKRIYAISGADDKIMGKRNYPASPYTSSSIYAVRKTRIEG